MHTSLWILLLFELPNDSKFPFGEQKIWCFFLQSHFFKKKIWTNVKLMESIPELLSTLFHTHREKVASSDCCRRISESISLKAVGCMKFWDSVVEKRASDSQVLLGGTNVACTGTKQLSTNLPEVDHELTSNNVIFSPLMSPPPPLPSS